MYNLATLDGYYKKYVKSLNYWIPEGFFPVNLALLHRFDLLHFHRSGYCSPTLNNDFQVIESPEKITLINNDFVIWIVSEQVNKAPVTYALIAVNKLNQLKLEVAFTASGIYNNSRLILRLLEKFLIDIQETDSWLAQLEFKT